MHRYGYTEAIKSNDSNNSSIFSLAFVVYWGVFGGRPTTRCASDCQ
jgi:hypothetical protein